MTHDKLWLCVLSKEQHERTCNYWFTITSDGMAHTAFTHISGLLTWLAERGLKTTEKITAPGDWSCQRIEGTYSSDMHMDPAIFDALEPIIETRTLSNGDYVLAKITEENGHRTVHTLNPNVRDRLVFDYQESQAIYR